MTLTAHAKSGDMVILQGFPKLTFLIVILIVPSILHADQASVRPEPGGKRLLFVDGDNIRDEPGGKRLLFIDDKFIRDEPGGKKLLYLDGDNIRDDFGGIRLAFVDGKNIRRTPGGKRLLFIDGSNVREEPNGKRLLFIDGDVSRKQLIALLYHLKPEVFKLTKEEDKALREEMKKNEKESEKDFVGVLLGKFDVLNSSESDWKSGTITTVQGKDKFHYLEMKLKGSTLSGIGMKRPWNGMDELWIAFAPEGATALAVYEIDKGKLNGKWIPMNAAKEGKDVLGVEVLEGPENLKGEYKIVEAKAPNNGDAYTGTVTIAPHTPKNGNSSDLFDLFDVTWKFGDVKVLGVGAKMKVGGGKFAFVAASSTKGEFAVGHVTCESATLSKGIDFFSNTRGPGYIVWTKNK